MLGYDAGEAIDRIGRDAVRRGTFLSLQAIVTKVCRTSPLVLCIEDLHWIDPASEDFLRWLATAEAGMPLLVLCTYRPGIVRPSPEAFDLIAPTPLLYEEILELVRGRLGVKQIHPDLAELICEKSNGNPLFVEEIAAYLIKTGKAAVDNYGASMRESYDRIEPAEIPATLGGLLMQRVDRLDPKVQRVLEIAAVAGPGFTHDVLAKAAGMGAALDAHLETLEREDLVHKEGGRRYRIKHALVKDAVYATLLSGDRKKLHLSVARAMESEYPGREAEIAHQLADHYERTDDAESAVRYLLLAGQMAYKSYSMEETGRRYKRAFEVVAGDEARVSPALRLDLVLAMARLHYFLNQNARLIDLVERHLPLAEELGDASRLARCQAELGYGKVFAGEGEAGAELLKQAYQLGSSSGDRTSIGHAAAGLTWYYGYVAERNPQQRASASRFGEEAFEIGQELNDFWLAAKGLFALSISQVVDGDPALATRTANRLLSYSDAIEHPWPRIMAVDALSTVGMLLRDFEGTLRQSIESEALVTDPLSRVTIAMRKAAALAGLRRPREACMIFEAARDESLENKWLLDWAGMGAFYGAALVLDGQFGKGVREMEDAGERVNAWGYRSFRGIPDLILGETYLLIALGEERPSLAVMLRNIGFLLRTLPFVAKKAKVHLERAESIFIRTDATCHLAATKLLLGRLAAFQRRGGEATDLFNEARRLALIVGADNMVTDVDLSLRALATR